MFPLSCVSLCLYGRWPSSILFALPEQAIHWWYTGIAFHLSVMLQLVAEALQRTLCRLRIAGEHRRAHHVGSEQAAEGLEAVDMGTLVAMGGVAAEGQQRGADVMAGGDC